MSRVAITGTSSRLNAEQIELVKRTLTGIEGVTQWWTGAARNTDAIACGLLLREYPEAQHIIIIPRWTGGLCKHYAAGVEAAKRIAAANGTDLVVKLGPNEAKTEEAGLLRRNDILACSCTHMIAFPRHRPEEQRSGTWATIRRAQRLARPVKLVPLDGSRGCVLGNSSK